jgi:glyoxylate reductase
MNEAVVAITRRVPGWREVPGARTTMVDGMRALPRPELLEFVRGARVVVTWVSEKVDAEFLDACGPGLRGVCNFAVGTDNVDLEACRRRGVIVTNTPGAVTEGTANLAWALILSCARRVTGGDAYVRSGAFAREGPLAPAEFLGVSVGGGTLLIVGAGRIGMAVALRGAAFGMRTLYVARSRHMDFEGAPLCARRVTLDEGLREADVVSIHTPLTSETRGMIGSSELALMKPSAILVNTARGPVVREGALVGALRERRIWGAGLDVFEDEPRVHPGLIEMKNCVLTPHVGSGEERYRVLMAEMCWESASAIIAGREPARRVVEYPGGA